MKKTRDCAICLEPINDDVPNENQTLDCSHIFHKACVGQWVQQQNSCPNCRAIVNNSSHSPIVPANLSDRVLFPRGTSPWMSNLDERLPFYRATVISMSDANDHIPFFSNFDFNVGISPLRILDERPNSLIMLPRKEPRYYYAEVPPNNEERSNVIRDFFNQRAFTGSIDELTATVLENLDIEFTKVQGSVLFNSIFPNRSVQIKPLPLDILNRIAVDLKQNRFG
ncbi:MAG: E3 ubiquitin protein ligase [Chlamydiales bacterium]|nr:E3 ubiquitin protein ligase [Chlamydiales bacterium]